ncbi:unnamed protein product [Ranitomeya imitator]|uniref:ribonuclease H n=1 Tax=Ranitomeya imitator TaxID=111125 RepID=A0ABN9MC31_9NEOB|nr:unnamed protein product [Ranitomeya imitator]
MPFGLSNAPSVFQSFMHDIFREYLDRFMIVYLDDILVFSDDWESHVKQVEVDASEIGAGAVLSQRSSDGSVMKPCAFFSRKFSPAERNYDVGNRELLAKKWAFEEWRHWLEGAKHRVVVLTDHKNLTYLESAKRLNPRQARWSLFFSRFDFVVSYLPGSKNVKADALSRSFVPDSPGVPEPAGILKEGVEPSDCPGVDTVVDRLQQIWTHVVDNLTLSQEKAQRFANRRRCVGPRLRVGDLVWLSSRHVPMKVSSPKFKPRFIGPYKISEALNPVSFHLALPASFAIHNVFHRSLLRRYVAPMVPSVDPPAPVLVEGELEYVVEKILDSRVSRWKLQYLVKWKGYGQEDNSWVFASDVHAADLVRAFHLAHPDRPGGSVGYHDFVLLAGSSGMQSGTSAPKFKVDSQPIINCPAEFEVKSRLPISGIMATNGADQGAQVCESPELQNVVDRVAQLPLVSSACSVVSSAYNTTKDSHPYIRNVCDVAEKGAKTLTDVAVTGSKPLISRLEPQSVYSHLFLSPSSVDPIQNLNVKCVFLVATANELACKGLDKLESTLPILQQPAEKDGNQGKHWVVSDTKELVTGARDAVVGAVTGTVTGARDTVTSAVSGIMGLAAGAVQGSVDATRSVVSTVMDTQVGQFVTSSLDTVLGKSEEWVDHYLPMTDEELSQLAATVEGFEVAPIQQQRETAKLLCSSGFSVLSSPSSCI